VTERSSADWPKISVIIGGAQESPATRHTAGSVTAGDYPGQIQLLTGSVGEQASPAAIANAHAAEASGNLLIMLPPGATLDPQCLQRLAVRLLADDRLQAVAPEWQGPDGSRLDPGDYTAASIEIYALLRRLLGTVAAAPLPVDPIPGESMLVATKRFFAVGGYDLSLDDSPYLGADFANRLAGPDGAVAVEAGAVAFAPARPAGGPATATSADARPEPRDIRPRAHRVLWAAAHLPDRNRSGIDARHFEMIESLARSGAEVLVWAEHACSAHLVGRELTAAGIQWIAPPPDRRWSLGRPPESSRWLDDLLGGIAWDTVVIGQPRLAGRIVPQVLAIAPHARTIVDSGTARFGAPPDPADVQDLLRAAAGVDAVVVATASDATVLEQTAPGLRTFTFGALGRGSGGHGSIDGGLLFVGDLSRRHNLLAVEWWMDAIAGRVQARLGYDLPLRVVGHGSESHRADWNHPTKIDVAGWQDRTSEFNRARLLVVPLTMVSGTGGRIASALAHGVPVVASSEAVAVLPTGLAKLVHRGEKAADLADQIAHLMQDDAAWQAARADVAAADLGALRDAQAAALIEWLDVVAASPGLPAPSTLTRRTRRALRRRRRAS